MNCSWDRPGHNPYMGDVVGAVDRYTDIPADVRARLKKRMAAREYDDLVSIKRDSIAGKQSYDPAIRDMHFGWNSVCNTVTRDKWTPQMEERGLVYCEGTTCILVPTVCRNVSRIDRAAPTAAAAAAPPADEIDMPPTAAGEPVAPAAPDDFAGLPPPGAGPVPGTGLAAVPLGPTAFIPGSSGGGFIPGPSFPPSPPTIPLGGGGSVVPPPVPEPGTWAMMAGGLLMLALMRRRAARPALVRARRDA